MNFSALKITFVNQKIYFYKKITYFARSKSEKTCNHYVLKLSTTWELILRLM